MVLAIVVAVSFFSGFGLGRIKNAAKLAAVRAELDAAEKWISTEARTLIAKIRSKL